MDVTESAKAIVGLDCTPKILGSVSPPNATDTPALPVFRIELVNVPIDPKETVPKGHAVASAVFAMIAPRACMTSERVWGLSSAASVVMVRVSEKGVGSFGFATFCGTGDGVTVIVALPPMGSVAGR